MFSNNPAKCLLSYSFVFLLLFSACDKETTLEKPFIVPPIAHLDPVFTTIDFDAAEGLTYNLENGGEILIPANSLLDGSGKAISGKVKAQYREFHDVGNIFLAGIPMSLEVDGKEQHFETAGSFQLLVEQNGAPLSLNPNQPAQVKMASYEAGADYDFYYLDENKRSWTERGQAEPIENLVKKKAQKKLASMKTGLRFPLNRKYLAFNYNIIVDMYLNNDLRSVNHDFIQQKMKGYGLGWADVEITNSIEVNGKQELAGLMVWKQQKKKAFPVWTNKQRGTVELIKGKRHRLHIYSKDSSNYFTADLEWVMPLKSLFAFPPEEWKNNYQATVKKIEDERARVENMAEVYRSFEVAEFGIYNWDRLMKEKNRVELMAHYEFDTPIDERLNQVEVLYISGDNKSLIRLQNNMDRPTAFIKDEKARIFSILPGNQLALFSAEEFAAIDFDDLATKEKPDYHFKLKAQAVDLVDENTFKRLLGI